jgi:hypothetical protein
VPTGDGCRLAGEPHYFEFPERAIRPKLLRNNICGCGLVLDPVDKLWIFFTLNSKLLGKLVLQVLILRIKKGIMYISNNFTINCM